MSDNTDRRLALAKDLFTYGLRRPLYPSCIYSDPDEAWQTLYANPGKGDTAWQDLVAALLRLGWTPPPEES